MMTPGFNQSNVRQAGLRDLKVLVELMRRFYAESAFDLDPEWAKQSFSALLTHRERGSVLVASTGEEDCGYAVLSVRHTMEFGGLGAYIDDIYVAPEYRLAGAGSALLSALVEDGRTRGCRSIHVEVPESNTGAMRLYTKHGLKAHSDGRVLMSASLPGRNA